MIVLDCRPGGAWAQGHFAGALDADLDRFLSTASDPGFDPAEAGRHPLPAFERWAVQLGAWGIGPQTPVLVYDGARGEMGACRAWWMLKASGHGPVEVLEGGIEAGKAQGLVWTTEPTPSRPVAPYPGSGWLWPTVDADDVARALDHPRGLVIDVRAPERWRGEVEPLDPVVGRIPGSTNVFLGRNLGADGRFLAPDALAAIYRPLVEGVDPGHTVVHCGSGVSACATLYAFHKAGLPVPALYVGSYSQWCRSGRPVARGA